jgi:hypothetical protein
MFDLPGNTEEQPVRSNNGRRQADGFLNISIAANTESGYKKIATGYLHMSVKDEKQLIEALESGQLDAQQLVSIMKVEYKRAGDSAGFDLSGVIKAAEEASEETQVTAVTPAVTEETQVPAQ